MKIGNFELVGSLRLGLFVMFVLGVNLLVVKVKFSCLAILFGCERKKSFLGLCNGFQYSGF